MDALTSVSTPQQAFANIREHLSEAAAIASAAHDWDVYDALQGITWTFQVVDDLEKMVAADRAELAKFRSRWGTP
jgi:hypothetical protein